MEMSEKNTLVAVGLGILFLILLIPGFGMGGMMGIGMGIGLVFWVAVAALLYYAIIGREEKEKSALEILKERYARGEISREEYLRMKEEIGG
jgi:putative membrane protein